jgi:hypothetical protein
VIARFGGHGPNMEENSPAHITEFTERNRQPVQVPEERRRAAEDKYVARLDRLTTNFVKDFDVLVEPYVKHAQKRVLIPNIDA